MTDTQKQALNALGIRPHLLDEAGLVDMLTQEFNTQRELALDKADAVSIRYPDTRVRFGMAAILAELLQRYYESIGAAQAERWAAHARLNHKRAFPPKQNKIGKNIGAEMP